MYLYLNGKNIFPITEENCIEIDDDIARTVGVLCRKGYDISACYSGQKCAYIRFNNTPPGVLPPDWYWCGRNQQMECVYIGSDRAKEIAETMDRLYEWSLTLPERSNK